MKYFVVNFWHKLGMFLLARHAAALWVLAVIVLLTLGWLVWEHRVWARRHYLKVSAGVLVLLIVSLLIVWPKISFYYDTRLVVLKHFSAVERQQFYDRQKEVLQDKAAWGKNKSGLYNNIGIIRSGMGDYAGAESSFNKAISLEPNDPRFWRNLAISYTSQSKYSDAEVAFRQVFKLAPTAPEYWLELGELYTFQIQDKTKARLFYLEAVNRTGGSNLSVAQAFANYLENVEKDYPEAIKYWQIVADGLPTKDKLPFASHIAELKSRYNIK